MSFCRAFRPVTVSTTALSCPSCWKLNFSVNQSSEVASDSGELLQSNFTKPADDLVAAVRSMAPSLSAREAEILLAATSTAVKHTASMFQTLDSLRLAGGPAGPAEKGLTRQVAYLTVGHRWPRSAPNDDAASLSSESSPVMTNRTDLVNSWLADHPQAPNLNASSGFAIADRVALPELVGVTSRHRSRPSTPADQGDRRRCDHHHDDRRRWKERREPQHNGDRDRHRH